MDSVERRETHYVRCLKCNKILECSRYDTNALLEHIRTDHPEIEIVDSSTMPNKEKKQTTPDAAAASAKSPKKVKSAENEAEDKSRTYTQDMFDKTPEEQSRTYTQDMLNKSSYKKFHPTVYSSRDSERMRSQKGTESSKGELQSCDVVSSNDSGGYTRRYHVQSPSYNATNRSLYRTSIEKWRPANGTIFCPRCCVNQRPLIRTQAERTSNNSCCAACILGCWPFCFLPFLVPSDSKEYLHCSNCRNFLGLYDRENNCIKPNRDFLPSEDEAPVKKTVLSEASEDAPAKDSSAKDPPTKNHQPPIIESSQNVKPAKKKCCH